MTARLPLLCLVAALAACRDDEARETADLVITRATIITMDSTRRVLEDAAIAVRADRIVAIGPTDSIIVRFRAREVIDAHRTIVMPGLIDGHGHAGHGLVKSLGMDTGEWYPATETIYAAASSVEFWRAEAFLTGVERLRFGVTTALSFLGGGDMVMRTDDERYGDAYMAAMDSVGTRFILAVGPRRPPFPRRYVDWTGDSATARDVTFERQREVSEALIKRWHGAGDGRLGIATMYPTIRPDEGPIAPGALAEIKAQAGAMRELSRRHGVLFTQDGHTTGSVQFAHEQLGLLGPDALFSHSTELTDREIRLLVETGTRVVHNPSANAATRRRFQLVEMLDAGVLVMLGSDGVAPDRSYDMFRHIFQAMRYHRFHFRDTDVLPPGKVLEMVTVDAARALGLERDIGSLEVGKKADFILVDWWRPHLVPMQMPLYRVAYFANGNDVRTVVVNGRVLMRDRVVLSVNESRVLEDADREATLALRRSGLDSLTRTPAGFWGQSRYRRPAAP